MTYKIDNVLIGEKNSNGRIYTKELIKKNIIRDPKVKEALKMKTLFVEYNKNEPNTILVEKDKKCRRVKMIYIEDNSLYIDCEKIPTECGEKRIKGVTIFGNGSVDKDGIVGNYTFYKFIAY